MRVIVGEGYVFQSWHDREREKVSFRFPSALICIAILMEYDCIFLI